MVRLFLLFFIISCAVKPTIGIEMDNKKTDPYIKNKLKEFNINTKTPIKFKEVEDKYVAICKKYKTESLNVIYINKKEWDKTSELQKKLVLIHEIGHCDKNLEHDNKLLKDGCPASIMYQSLFSSKCFKQYEKKYYNQVFGVDS
jgi:hypothetical protein